MSISSRIFHQIAVKNFFWSLPDFGASFSSNCCRIPNASGQDYESISPCNISQFKCCLHPILTKPANYFPIMPQLMKITMGTIIYCCIIDQFYHKASPVWFCFEEKKRSSFRFFQNTKSIFLSKNQIHFQKIN